MGILLINFPYLWINMLHYWEDVENIFMSERVVRLSRGRATVELIFFQHNLDSSFEAEGSQE